MAFSLLLQGPCLPEVGHTESNFLPIPLRKKFSFLNLVWMRKQEMGTEELKLRSLAILSVFQNFCCIHDSTPLNEILRDYCFTRIFYET